MTTRRAGVIALPPILLFVACCGFGCAHATYDYRHTQGLFRDYSADVRLEPPSGRPRYVVAEVLVADPKEPFPRGRLIVRLPSGSVPGGPQDIVSSREGVLAWFVSIKNPSYRLNSGELVAVLELGAEDRDFEPLGGWIRVQWAGVETNTIGEMDMNLDGLRSSGVRVRGAVERKRHTSLNLVPL
jgi:hypothetical protein